MSFVHCIFVIVFCVIFLLGAIKSLCYVMLCNLTLKTPNQHSQCKLKKIMKWTIKRFVHMKHIRVTIYSHCIWQAFAAQI